MLFKQTFPVVSLTSSFMFNLLINLVCFLSMLSYFGLLLGLQSKAKEMVMLAEKMRLKLLSGSNSQTNATNDEEMGSKEEMQDWLLSVGIISPVTKESAGALYHQQLSRQVLISLLCALLIQSVIDSIRSYCFST